MSPVEYFLLTKARAAARKLSDADRSEASRALFLGVTCSAAAETAWASGSRAEGLRLAVTALERALEAARRMDASSPLAHALVSLGIDRRGASRITATTEASGMQIPDLGGELDAIHAQLFPELIWSVRAIEDALALHTQTEAELGRTRRIRATVAMVVLLSFGVAAWVLSSPSDQIIVTASGYRTADVVETWPPENAVDRDEMTYWHLPPGETGWIELRLSPPRDVGAVRLLNAHDLHADDRNRRDRRRYDHASRTIVVRAFAGPREVIEAPHELSRLTGFDRVTIPIGATNVDRIRIDVTEFYGAGGGLAEIEVLE